MSKAINPAWVKRIPGRAYAVCHDQTKHWRYLLLMSYQADNAAPRAKFEVQIEVPGGGTRVGPMPAKRAVVLFEAHSANMAWDQNIWPTREALFAWMKGSKTYEPQP